MYATIIIIFKVHTWPFILCVCVSTMFLKILLHTFFSLLYRSEFVVFFEKKRYDICLFDWSGRNFIMENIQSIPWLNLEHNRRESMCYDCKSFSQYNMKLWIFVWKETKQIKIDQIVWSHLFFSKVIITWNIFIDLIRSSFLIKYLLIFTLFWIYDNDYHIYCVNIVDWVIIIIIIFCNICIMITLIIMVAT